MNDQYETAKQALVAEVNVINRRFRRRRIIQVTIDLVTNVGIAVALFVGGWFAHQVHGPNCPTEDSCVAVYRDGAWTVERAHP